MKTKTKQPVQSASKQHVTVYPMRYSADIARQIRELDPNAKIYPRAIVAKKKLPPGTSFKAQDILPLQERFLNITGDNILCHVAVSELSQLDVTRITLSLYNDPEMLAKEQVLNDPTRTDGICLSRPVR